jgi:hypothetical protein
MEVVWVGDKDGARRGIADTVGVFLEIEPDAGRRFFIARGKLVKVWSQAARQRGCVWAQADV